MKRGFGLFSIFMTFLTVLAVVWVTNRFKIGGGISAIGSGT